MNRKTPHQICVDIINNNEKNTIENSLDVKFINEYKAKEHISIFLDKNKEIFNDKDEESRIKLVRSKIFGMRQTFRRRFRKSMNRV
ncbi:UNVERIFIED_CONTAM: hypothetical protein RMT77_003509 [Armadillidium vulgare]